MPPLPFFAGAFGRLPAGSPPAAAVGCFAGGAFGRPAGRRFGGRLRGGLLRLKVSGFAVKIKGRAFALHLVQIQMLHPGAGAGGVLLGGGLPLQSQRLALGHRQFLLGRLLRRLGGRSPARGGRSGGWLSGRGCALNRLGRARGLAGRLLGGRCMHGARCAGRVAGVQRAACGVHGARRACPGLGGAIFFHITGLYTVEAAGTPAAGSGSFPRTAAGFLILLLLGSGAALGFACMVYVVGIACVQFAWLAHGVSSLWDISRPGRAAAPPGPVYVFSSVARPPLCPQPVAGRQGFRVERAAFFAYKSDALL